MSILQRLQYSSRLLRILSVMGIWPAFVVLNAFLDVSKYNPPHLQIFVIIIAYGSFLCSLALLVLIYLAGYYIGKRRHYKYCKIVSLLLILGIPVGTMIGYFVSKTLQTKEAQLLFSNARSPVCTL